MYLRFMKPNIAIIPYFIFVKVLDKKICRIFFTSTCPSQHTIMLKNSSHQNVEKLMWPKNALRSIMWIFYGYNFWSCWKYNNIIFHKWTKLFEKISHFFMLLSNVKHIVSFKFCGLLRISELESFTKFVSKKCLFKITEAQKCWCYF